MYYATSIMAEILRPSIGNYWQSAFASQPVFELLYLPHTFHSIPKLPALAWDKYPIPLQHCCV